jgi:hypothetical protein
MAGQRAASATADAENALRAAPIETDAGRRVERLIARGGAGMNLREETQLTWRGATAYHEHNPRRFEGLSGGSGGSREVSPSDDA